MALLYPPCGYNIRSTKYLRVWLFCLWPGSPPKRRVIRRRNFAGRRVPIMLQGFMPIGVVFTKIMTFFHKCVHTFAAVTSVQSVEHRQ